MRMSAIPTVCMLAALALPGTAAAGQYSVANCHADAPSFSTRAFEHFATRGMLIKRACNPEGPGLRGLITANVLRRKPLRRGAVSFVRITAPPGTAFTTFRWAGTARRRDCRFALQVYAMGSGHKFSIKNVRANRHCPRGPRAQMAGWQPKTYTVTGATRIVQRVICVGGRGTNMCSARGMNFIRTYTATAGIVDNTAPLVSITRNTPLALGTWMRGFPPLYYAAADNVGVRSARALVSGQTVGTHQRPCTLAAKEAAYTAVVPCPNGPGAMQIDTTRLTDGTRSLVVQAYDSAGNARSSSAVTVRIDNTAPGRVNAVVEGGEQWRSANGYVIRWVNPNEPDRAPIAGARYKLCPVGPGTCMTGQAVGTGLSSLDVQVPSQGEWTLSLWRRDAAGNESEAVASVPVTLRYDAEPPRLAFAQQSAADPTLVSVAVSDNASGVADGAIEVSRQGSGTWQVLQTTTTGDRLVARLDDATLAAGTYLLRAHARDRAGNESSTNQRSDGTAMVLTLPIRAISTMRVGVERTKLVWRTVRRHGKRRRVRRPVTVLTPSAPVAFGGRAVIRGKLMDRNARGVRGAAVQVFSRSLTNSESPVAVVRSDSQGRFSYTASGTMSRTLRFMFGGSALRLPAQREVGLRVPAASSLRVDRRRVLNGQAVRFSGTVRSLPLPSSGKLVELQVRLSDRWQTFRTRRTDSAGRWSIPYRFRRTVGVQRYRFRLRMPREAAYPFETGTSRSIVVRVRGR